VAYNKHQFKSLIERTLFEINLYSPAATNLLLGTAAQESRFGTYLKQIRGPAIGAFQVEPNTFNDLRAKYKDPRLYLRELVRYSAADMEWNLRLAIIMCRLKYRSIMKPLPDADDLPGLAGYWKKYYNTPLGAGTEAEFIENYRKYVA
jgi:hypothetical protein